MSYWTCAQLVPGRERLALHCLSAIHGFEIYSPRIQAPLRARRAGDLTRPLFPSYAFVLIIAQWWQARWSPGVIRLVLDGAVPARVPDPVIAALRARERDGVVQLPKPPGPKVGDQVRVLGGPFRGQLGLYAGMRPHQRCEVLLAILGQTRVTLPQAAITAAVDT